MMMYFEFPILQSERLLFRQHEMTDVESYFKIMSDSSVVRYYGKYPLKDLSEAHNDLSLFHKEFVNGTMIKWVLEHKENKKYVGSIGAFGLSSPHKRTTISCVLDKQFWGMGLAKEGLQTVIQFLFKDIGMNRIQLYVDPINIKAVGLFESLGFRKEGLLREYEFEYGHAVDLLIMSILKKEWKKEEFF